MGLGEEGAERGVVMELNLAALQTILVWSVVVNYAILMIWFVVLVVAHDWVYRLHGRWFRMSRESFDTVHYGSMAAYKIGILLFNVAPLVGVLVAT